MIFHMLLRKLGGVAARYIPLLNKIRLRSSKLVCDDAILIHSTIDCRGKNNLITVCDGAFLDCSQIKITGNNNNVVIGKNVKANNLVIWLENDGNSVLISENTVFTNNVRIACIEGQTVRIGKDCLFSSDITIRTGDSHAVLNSQGERINVSRSVIIGDHVWIGQRVIILKGVDIMRDTVVAAGSVLTQCKYKPNVMIAGVPAKIVKENINWDSDRKKGVINKEEHEY